MNTKQLIDYLRAFDGATESYPFGPDTQVFKVKNKMYALIGHRNGKDFINLKAKPEDVLFLSEQYAAITPGYHMNKLHWISVHICATEIAGIIERLVEDSYQLVCAKLPEKQRPSGNLQE